MTSQINPNNVDGTFPVAGQPNNTQGFRDNFTNIKTNFSYAETEITDLENNGIFKAALAGTTLNNNMADNLIYAVKLQDVSYTYVQNTASSGSITIDYSAGQYQLISTTGSVSLSFANWPVSGTSGIVQIAINVTSTAHTLTLPAAVTLGTTGIQGYSGGVITFAETGTYQFSFSSVDYGTTVTIYDLNRPLSYFTNPVTVASTTNSTSSGTGALIVAGGVGVSGNLYVSGNIVGSIVATGNTFAGNTTVGNLLTSGLVSATGNVTGGNVLTGGLINATGNVTGGNLNATGLSLSGNVVSVINMTANITTTGGNIQGGNLKTGGIASATGNVTGGNILTGGLISATSTITSSANITGGNILTSGLVSVTGNITSGNVNTGGLISVVGNIIGGNVLNGGLISSTGNSAAANYLTTGLISATGNITGGNVLGGANVNATTHTGTTVSVTGNITGGNINTAGVVTATGNITGNNILSNDMLSAVGNARILSGYSIPLGGSAGKGYTFSSTANLGVFFGIGVPLLIAAQGSLYLRTDGGTTTNRMYINTDGATTWTSVITVS